MKEARTKLRYWFCRFYVPLATIRRIKPWLFFGGCTVFHESPEVRSPLEIPSTSIRTALERLLAQRDRTRTTERVELDGPHDLAQ